MQAYSKYKFISNILNIAEIFCLRPDSVVPIYLSLFAVFIGLFLSTAFIISLSCLIKPTLALINLLFYNNKKSFVKYVPNLII